MNFTEKIKRQILLRKQGNVKAFLSGFIRSAGAIIAERGQYGFQIVTESEEIVTAVYSVIKSEYNAEGKTETEEDTLNKRVKYVLSYTGGKAIAILSDLEILDAENRTIILNTVLEGRLISDSEDKRAFIQGTFLGAGTCTVPTDFTSKKTSFHLEVIFPHHDSASVFCRLLASFDIFASLTARRDYFIVYLKSWEQITDFLVVLNAPEAVAEIVEIKTRRDANNAANRQVNCDMANMDKQGRASDRQISAIKIIESVIGLDALGPQLAETAKARLTYPDESLSDLSERLSVTKSGLNHRLRKIVNIADNLQN